MHCCTANNNHQSLPTQARLPTIKFSVGRREGVARQRVAVGEFRSMNAQLTRAGEVGMGWMEWDKAA